MSMKGKQSWVKKSSDYWIHDSGKKNIAIVEVYDQTGGKNTGKKIGYDIFLGYVMPNWKRWYTKPVNKSSKQLNKRRFTIKDRARTFALNWMEKN